MADYSPFIIPILSGVIIAVVTQSIAYYYSRRSIKAQRELSLKIAGMQLYHNEKKEALLKLDELLKKKYKTFPEFNKAVDQFLDGSDGIFLPKKLRLDLEKQVGDVSLFLSIKEAELYGEPPDYTDDYQDWLADLSPEEQVDNELSERLSNLKKNMRDSIKENVAGG